MKNLNTNFITNQYILVIFLIEKCYLLNRKKTTVIMFLRFLKIINRAVIFDLIDEIIFGRSKHYYSPLYVYEYLDCSFTSDKYVNSSITYNAM